MLLYAITDRAQLPGTTDNARREALVALARTWAEHQIDYIQIREKDLAPPDLLTLTKQIVAAVREHSAHTRILLNGPASIALDSGADGIHVAANASPHAAAEARALFASAGRSAVISYACHSRDEVIRAREDSQLNLDATTANTLILYAPVFEKVVSAQTPGDHSLEKLPGLGLESLKRAAEAAHPIPVFALGGVTLENAPACLAVGAAGIAAIRLFLANGWQSLHPAPL